MSAGERTDVEDVVASGIGAAVRRRRQAAGLSMRELAALAGMSQPFLSNLENSRAMPSIATLYRIAHALGVSPRDFLPDEPGQAVALVRRGEGVTGPVGDELGSAMSQLVAGAPGRSIEAHTYVVEPNSGLGGWFEHEGEDLLFVVAGSVRVELADGHRFELHAGDVLWHVSTIPHRWLPHGDVTAQLLLVNARPLAAQSSAHGHSPR